MRLTVLLVGIIFWGHTLLYSQYYNAPEVVNVEELLHLINKKDDTIRLFNFWATWCRPCVKELPYFEELKAKMASVKYRQYLISLDFTDQISKNLIPFLKKKKISSEILVLEAGDPNIWIDQIEPRWSGTIPASLVSSGGQRCFIENSFEDTESLLKFIHQCTP